MRKGSDLIKVPPTEVRKRQMEIHAILSAVFQEERKKNTWWEWRPHAFFWHACLCFADSMEKVSMLKQFEAQCPSRGEY